MGSREPCPKVPLKSRVLRPSAVSTGKGVKETGDPLIVNSTLVEPDSRAGPVGDVVEALPQFVLGAVGDGYRCPARQPILGAYADGMPATRLIWG